MTDECAKGIRPGCLVAPRSPEGAPVPRTKHTIRPGTIGRVMRLGSIESEEVVVQWPMQAWWMRAADLAGVCLPQDVERRGRPWG